MGDFLALDILRRDKAMGRRSITWTGKNIRQVRKFMKPDSPICLDKETLLIEDLNSCERVLIGDRIVDSAPPGSLYPDFDVIREVRKQ